MSELGPITAELRAALDVDREFMRADGTVVAQTFCVDRGDFERLCDAIDAVHAGLERENAELRERVAVLDESADSMHGGWVRLPLDADGVPFHIGELVDEMLPFGGYAAPAPIDTMELYRGTSGYGWMVKLDAENRALISPKLLRHHHAPTVEDVLTKFGIDWEYESDCEDRAALLAEYAAKLRLAGDAE